MRLDSPGGRPLDIGFELTNLCNLHCDHCIRGPHQPAIDRLGMPLFRRILDQVVERFDPVAVAFTGGEPLAAPDFPAAVAELARRGIAYRFVTNGWLLPRHAALLAAHPPSFVRVSLSGGREATHDAARGRGSFRRALLGAAVMLTRGIRVELALLVTRAARAELAEAVEVARRLGVSELHVTLPQPTPVSALEQGDLAPDEWDGVEREVARVASTTPVPLVVDYGTRLGPSAPPCRTMAMRQVYVDARGRVPFCCQLSRYGEGEDPIIGDLRTESLGDVLARAERRYAAFSAETVVLRRAGRLDALDRFPCLSCARRHGKTAFLARFPGHPWAALARPA